MRNDLDRANGDGESWFKWRGITIPWFHSGFRFCGFGAAVYEFFSFRNPQARFPASRLRSTCTTSRPLFPGRRCGRKRPLSSQLNIMAFTFTRARNALQSGNYFQKESYECTNKRETKLFILAPAIFTKRIRILPIRFTDYLCADIFEENKIPSSNGSWDSSESFVGFVKSIRVDTAIVAINIIIDIDYGWMY